jgi:hypothetical protein
MRRYDEPSNDLGPSSSHQTYLDCIIAMRGYDVREGQGVKASMCRAKSRSCFARLRPWSLTYLDLIGAETSDHLWGYITKKAEGFASPIISTATLAVETGIGARTGTVIVRK